MSKGLILKLVNHSKKCFQLALERAGRDETCFFLFYIFVTCALFFTGNDKESHVRVYLRLRPNPDGTSSPYKVSAQDKEVAVTGLFTRIDRLRFSCQKHIVPPPLWKIFNSDLNNGAMTFL